MAKIKEMEKNILMGIDENALMKYNDKSIADVRADDQQVTLIKQRIITDREITKNKHNIDLEKLRQEYEIVKQQKNLFKQVNDLRETSTQDLALELGKLEELVTFDTKKNQFFNPESLLGRDSMASDESVE